MARSPLFTSVSRLLRLGSLADRRGWTAHQVMERAGEAAQYSGTNTRRQVLLGAGAAAVAAGASFGAIGSVFATNPRSQPRVAIIGGGLAGLACAERLQRAGILATIYEANTTRVGGRVHSVGDVFPGQVGELGGEMIDTTHQTMRGFARSLGLTLERVDDAPGAATFFFGGSHHTEEEVVAEYCELVQRLRPDMQAISGAPDAWNHTAADVALDQMDLASYLDSRAAGLPLIRAVLDEAYVAEYGLEAHEQSALNMLLFLHLDCRSHFSEFGVWSDERFHVVQGNQAIAEGLAASLSRPLVHGARLTSLARAASGAYRLGFAGGGTEEADAVVLAVPFSVLRNVSLSPTLGLPPEKIHAIQQLGYGANCKTMVGFEGRPWSVSGFHGKAYSDLSELQTTWETSWRTAGATSVLTDYASGDRARDLQVVGTAPYCGQCHGSGPNFLTMHDGLMQSQAEAWVASLDDLWPGTSTAASRRPDGGLVMARGHWLPQNTARGSYTCYLPGQFTTIAGLEGQSVGALKFAGEHADSFYSWQGFMEGAALSGLAAAEELIDDVRQGRI